jgi:hypothetical protein
MHFLTDFGPTSWYTPFALANANTYEHTCIHAFNIYTHLHACIHAYIHVYVYVHTYIHTYMHAHIHVSIHKYMNTHIEWYILECKHAHVE